MKTTNKTEKCKNSKKRSSSLLLVPLCLLLPIWLLITMPYYMSRNIYMRMKALLLRSDSTLITAQPIDAMNEELSDFETKAWLHLFADDVVLEAARDHLERTYYKTLHPEYDDPLI